MILVVSGGLQCFSSVRFSESVKFIDLGDLSTKMTSVDALSTLKDLNPAVAFTLFEKLNVEVPPDPKILT